MKKLAIMVLMGFVLMGAQAKADSWGYYLEEDCEYYAGFTGTLYQITEMVESGFAESYIYSDDSGFTSGCITPVGDIMPTGFIFAYGWDNSGCGTEYSAEHEYTSFALFNYVRSTDGFDSYRILYNHQWGECHEVYTPPPPVYMRYIGYSQEQCTGAFRYFPSIGRAVMAGMESAIALRGGFCFQIF